MSEVPEINWQMAGKVPDSKGGYYSSRDGG
jgi:hypothetical protein